jgi:hypothetical protein
MNRTLASSIGVVALMSFVLGCGSEAPTTPPAPAPAATASPSPAPTAVPTPAPTPTPALTGEEVYPGPVRSLKIRVYNVIAPSGEQRPAPFYDPRSDTDVAYEGDFVVLDLTPRNAQNQKCETDSNPTWIFEQGREFIRPRNSSNPFLFRTDTVGKGLVVVRGNVDGVLSNVIRVEIR